MRVCITGWNGFLALKLRERNNVIWTENAWDCDMLLHLGSPTFTNHELTKNDAQRMHHYVRDSIDLFNRYNGPIMFASTTGVNDIQLDHSGSTPYNLGKLYLENYLLSNFDQACVLRIGTIVSKSKRDIEFMKPDRIQPRIARGDFNIDNVDYYLDVDTFVDSTIKYILNFENGVREYELIKLTKTQLMLYGAKND